MKVYKLKKDLNNVPAGAAFRDNDNGDLICPFNRSVTIPRNVLDTFPGLFEEYFEEVLATPKTVWDLKNGDRCFITDTTGTEIYVREIDWDDCYEPDREIGGIFLTKEEAEKEIERRKAREILRRDTKGFKPDWNDDDENKWYITWQTYFGGQLVAERTQGYNYGELAFGSYRDAEESIKKHPEEWRNYLGVGES